MNLTRRAFCAFAAGGVCRLANAAPVPQPRRHEYPGNVVRGLSLYARLVPYRLDPPAVEKPTRMFRIDITLTNAGGRITLDDENGGLHGFPDFSDLHCTSRSPAGAVLSVFGGGAAHPRSGMRGFVKKVTLMPGEVRSGSFQVFDLGRWVENPRLIDTTKPFCTTAVLPSLGLKSNTVFVHGRFRLPADFDPLADHREYEKMKAAYFKKMGWRFD